MDGLQCTLLQHGFYGTVFSAIVVECHEVLEMRTWGVLSAIQFVFR